MGLAYYNENDPKAVAWLRELIAADVIANGIVDDRSILDVTPGDLDGFDQCHFFAGIGGWSLALRLAGWPDSRRVWTGSCPCQPFSAAGKGAGFTDERHLWPSFHWLIEQCRPSVVIGEQVASKAGKQWLDLVATDSEGRGYAVAAAVIPAASVKAPHLRDRLWWVADTVYAGLPQRVGIEGVQREALGAPARQTTERSGLPRGLAVAAGERRIRRRAGERRIRRRAGEAGTGRDETRVEPERFLNARELGDTRSERSGRDSGTVPTAQRSGTRERIHTRDLAHQFESSGSTSEQADPLRERQQERPVLVRQSKSRGETVQHQSAVVRGSETSYLWDDCDWIPCRDGKYRPVEPGTFPLAYGVPARVGRLRGYGNAIVPQVAAEFIRAYLEVIKQ